MKIRRQLEAAQLSWATSQGIALREGVEGRPPSQVVRLEDNLYTLLSDATRNEFLRGAGGELNPPEGEEGHLYSLSSSSALMANFFEHWRSRPLSPLLRAMGLADDIEYKWEFDPRLRISKHRVETPPVDLLLKPKSAGTPVIAIEAKFAEPYDGKPRRGLSPFYLTRKYLLGKWTHLTKMAKAMEGTTDEQHVYMHAAQSIRQMLALRANYGAGGFVLFHLWYDAHGAAGLGYRTELETFAARVRADRIPFAPLSWQELHARFGGELTSDEDRKWHEHLGNRYGLVCA